MEKRQKTLKAIFLKYLFISFVTLGISAIVPFLGYSVILNTDVLLSANYVENQIDNQKERLANICELKNNMIPDGASYMILDKEYVPKEGNVKDKFMEEAVLYAKGELKLKGRKRSYKVIERNNEYLILQYFI